MLGFHLDEKYYSAVKPGLRDPVLDSTPHPNRRAFDPLEHIDSGKRRVSVRVPGEELSPHFVARTLQVNWLLVSRKVGRGELANPKGKGSDLSAPLV